MQYGPIPTTLFERVALWTGRIPVPLMDALFSIMKARGLMAAVSLGVFDALVASPKTSEQLAQELQLDPASLELLLRALVAAEYLELTGRLYGLSKLSRTTMVSGAEMELTGFLKWNYVQWRMVEQMENLLRTGHGVDFHHGMTDSQEWSWYQQAMLEVARFDAPIMARVVPVKRGARRLLDIAGSHGLIGAAICRKHPPMRSIVIDLPHAIEHARQLATREGIADIVEHRPGDIMNTDLGKNNDVAILANITHHFSSDANIALLKRVADSMSEDATLAIWDLEAPDPGSKPSQGDGAALYFRLTSTARCYSGTQYSEWLRDTGCRRIRVTRPRLRPGYVLVTARR
jgi:hypothetical protein